jgi:probable HAF family extracellular repeat protein
MRRIVVRFFVLGLVVLFGVGALAPGASLARQADPQATPCVATPPPPVPSSTARDLNDRGQVVGTSWSADGGPHAVRWEAGQVVALGPLPGGSHCEAYAVNNAGQVVGWSETADGETHAVRWADGGITDLGAFSAADINDRGQIVGWSDGTAVLWQDGGITDLGALPGASESGATAINEAGQVVGWSGLGYGDFHAVLWADGRIIDLGTLPAEG